MIDNKLYRQFKHEQSLVGVPVSPQGLARAINREAIKLERQKPASKPAAPIIVPRPVGMGVATERVTNTLIEQGLMRSTVDTLQQFVSRHEGTMLARSWERGRPLPREVIRSALTDIYRRGEAQRKAVQRGKAS